jgi:hypothetical protein
VSKDRATAIKQSTFRYRLPVPVPTKIIKLSFPFSTLEEEEDIFFFFFLIFIHFFRESLVRESQQRRKRSSSASSARAKSPNNSNYMGGNLPPPLTNQKTFVRLYEEADLSRSRMAKLKLRMEKADIQQLERSLFKYVKIFSCVN